MEKEKKPRTTKKASTTKQSGATEPIAPKKAATRKNAGPVAVTAKVAEPKKTIARKKTTPTMTAMRVSHEEIARLAHRYWAERGHQHGHHVEDWLRAERELFGKAS
jgi:Protein of unknown function (DUF2934)